MKDKRRSQSPTPVLVAPRRSPICDWSMCSSVMHPLIVILCVLLAVSDHAPSPIPPFLKGFEPEVVPAAAFIRDDLESLRTELLEKRDRADELLISQLADLQTREAMEALIEVYDSMASTWMRLSPGALIFQYEVDPDALATAAERCRSYIESFKASKSINELPSGS